MKEEIPSPFPIGTKMYHTGNGMGVVVGHNTKEKMDEGEFRTRFEQALDVARENDGDLQIAADLLRVAMVNSLYDGGRYPYIVRYKPCEEYPEGYKDVYEPQKNAFSLDGRVWHYCVFGDSWVVFEADSVEELKAQIREAEDYRYACIHHSARATQKSR